MPLMAFAAPKRVAILPFEMNAAKDLTYLQEGVVDMLGTRLAWRDEVVVVSKSETKAALAAATAQDAEGRARQVGRALEADYVLYGSLTVFGESVSIDAKMADLSGGQPTLPFFAQTANMGEVIPRINQFATEINATVFGRGVAPQAAEAPAPQTAAPQAAAAPPKAPTPAAPKEEAPAFYDPRMHPEKLLESGMSAGAPRSAPEAADQPPNPAFVAAAPAAAKGGTTAWRSRNFKALITGIDVADVDADGRQDLIVVTDKQVSIYRVESGRLIRTADASETSQSAFVSVDAADINGNGTPEIYVTSLGSNRTTVDSFVIEYAGGAYQSISGSDNWFYRVANTGIPGTLLLLGQRQRYGEDSIFNGPVYEMHWEGGRLTPGRQLLPGHKTNLMGVAVGDAAHTGVNVIAAYSKQDRLHLYREGGNTIWADPDRSGGDMLFFNLPGEAPQDRERQYFPLRIRITDIDRDGKAEVMIAQHEELAKNLLKEFRQLKKGKLVLKEWNGSGLATKWETEELAGRVSDFTIGDMDNDGIDELVVAVILKEGRLLFTDSISSLIAFDLDS